MGASFGSGASQTLFGSVGSSNALTKSTAWLAVIFFATSLGLALIAKQRASHAHDWMSTDGEVACPDPNCPTRFRITRLQPRRFLHSQTTAVPLTAGQP
jgi:preprotein translocase subunit SecG